MSKRICDTANCSTTNDFERGYFCAVATLLKETGDADAMVKSLFSGGNWRNADKEDIELFKEHGLL